MIVINNLSQFHGNQHALDNVNLSISQGEVVGLVDRDGTGVLELVNILSGLTAPERGQVSINNKKLQWPFRPQEHSVGILFRDPQIVESLDIASNIFLGHETQQKRNWLDLVSWPDIYFQAEKLIASVNLNLPTSHTKASVLSDEQRQLTVIAQLVVQSPEIIIIDNPDRTLSLPYQEQLLEMMRDWQEKGRTIIFSSANLDYLFAVCDRIVVLRNGRVVTDVLSDHTNREEIVAALVGKRDRRHITPVIWALDSYYQALRQAELLRHSKLSLEQDLARQDSIKQSLFKQLSFQVDALNAANLALQDAQRRLLTEREQERKYLARELHDQMIQDLLSLNYQIDEILDITEAGQDSHTHFDELQESVRHLVDDLRQICGDLRPPTIDSFGLNAALQSYAQSWTHQTGIHVALDIDVAFRRLPEDIELSLFRIVQESLSNVRKHSQASEVTVRLRHTNPRMLLLTIVDNGVGLDSDFDLSVLAESGHYGLLGVTERVALLGGRINFRNQADGGLMIQVEVPHPRIEAAESTQQR